jgi:ribosomal protein S18 acetylase RimI-like enzyme
VKEIAVNIIIRPLKIDDLDDICRIDADILGVVRKDYYKEKLEKAKLEENQISNLAAVHNEKVVGFIMGRIYIGEYGIDQVSVIIDTIGVSPEYQGSGVAKKLFREFFRNVKKLGIRKVLTIVDWEKLDLLKFFHGEGFEPSKKIVLELNY